MRKMYIGFGFIVFVMLVALVWAGFMGAKEAASNQPTYTETDVNRPIAKVTEANYDLGNMSVDDIKDHEFEITNKGKSDLALARVTTSCDCTYAYVIQNGVQSEQFTMMGKSNYRTSVAPGETVKIKAVYEPSIMPVEGSVTRYVSVTTNDPNMPKLQFGLTANVSKN